MTLIDSSAWIAYLREADAPVVGALDRSLAEMSALTCGVVEMEVLAGARSAVHLSDLERLLGIAQRREVTDDDFGRAAELYRLCRQQGITIRSMNDCLLAAVALRLGVEILHDDRDFDRLAEVTGVRVRRS
jgi:predicted nucleic acid-binding protein